MSELTYLIRDRHNKPYSIEVSDAKRDLFDILKSNKSCEEQFLAISQVIDALGRDYAAVASAGYEEAFDVIKALQDRVDSANP